MRPDATLAGASVRIVRSVQACAHVFADDGAIPNNPALPLLVYPGALQLPGEDPAAACEAVFEANGWGGAWRDGIYPFAHYHSTAHECLLVYRGSAKVQLGGEGGIIETIAAGDVVIIPAGVGHKNVGASSDLQIVGAYPPEQQPDMCYGKPEERLRSDRNIARLTLE